MGTRIVAQSYPPCHLFGDPELYGLGIRLGFYLQYAAAIVALFVGCTRGLRSIRTGLAVLSVSLLTTLGIASTTGRGLVILDWYIVMALTGGLILFGDVFVCLAVVGVWLRGRLRGRGWVQPGEDMSAADVVGTDLARTMGVNQSALIEAGLAVHRSMYTLDDRLDRREPSGDENTALRHALIEFGRCARDTPKISARYSVESVARASFPLGFPQGHDGAVFDKKGFRSDLVGAARGTGMTNTEAEHVAQRIGLATRREASDRRSREMLAEAGRAFHANRPRDKLAIAVVCLSWSAYQFVRPWLYWRGLARGVKDGCDVKLMWFFVPASVHDRSFVTWLRVSGVILFVCGAAYLFYGLYLLGTNMFAAHRSSPLRSGRDEESQRMLLSSTVASSRDSSSAASTDTSDLHAAHAHRRAGRKGRFLLRGVAVFQAFLLAITVAVVEGTIAANGADMGRSGLGTCSQVMALVVGVGTSLPVFWECVVVAPARWVRWRRDREDVEGCWYPRDGVVGEVR